MPSEDAEALVRDPIGRALRGFTLPILCASVLGTLDISVNAMWVGRELGDVSLAAISNADLLWTVVFAVAFGIASAGAVVLSNLLGAGDTARAKRVVGTTITASAATSLVFVVPMNLFARPLIALLGTPAESMPQAVQYLEVILLSLPFSYVYGAVMTLLRGAGDATTVLYFSAISVAVDMALNPMFILGLGPVPRLGIEGSALATVVSQGVGVATLVGYLYCKRHSLCLYGRELRLLRMDAGVLGLILRKGPPMAVQFLWISLEGMVLISLVNRFGTDTTAAYGAALQLWSYVSMPAMAVGMAMTTMVAQNAGARRWDRIRSIGRTGILYGVLSTAVLIGVLEVLDQRAFELFLPSTSPALAIASQINREASWSLVFTAAYAVFIGITRGLGIVWVPLLISAAVLAARVPVTLALLAKWQAEAIWWSFPASMLITGIVAAAYYGLRLRVEPPRSVLVQSVMPGGKW